MAESLKKLLHGELIGKTAEITKSKNKTLTGLNGKIIDETKNMLTLMTGQEKKVKLIKNEVTIKIDGIEINGEKLQKKPEERIKTKKQR